MLGVNQAIWLRAVIDRDGTWTPRSRFRIGSLAETTKMCDSLVRAGAMTRSGDTWAVVDSHPQVRLARRVARGAGHVRRQTG